jgi:regulator of protease activity HflC (stomatin/prohibitin superfamily)
MRRFSPSAIFLWLEAIALFAIACGTASFGLLSVAGLLAWFAAALSGGWVLAFAMASAGAWCAFAGMPVGHLPSAAAVLALVAGVGLAFCGILSEIGGNSAPPHRSLLLRFALGLHFLTAGCLFALPQLPPAAPLGLVRVFAALTLLLLADTSAKFIARLCTPKRHWPELSAPGALFFFRWCGPAGRACFPAATGSDDHTLKLGEMWMWPVVRRSLPLFAAFTFLLVWLSSALHEINAGNLGVRHCGGRWEEANLSPGLHVSWPWPFGGVTQVDTGRSREIVLGFRTDPGQPILWERAHYEAEQKSLVGGGDDLLSISVPVFYRVADPAASLRVSEDLEGLLRSLAERTLLQLSLNRPAAELMTTAREPLRAEFLQRLQQDLDSRSSGLRLDEVYFRDIHPPVAVAPAFQEVVGAIEEKEAFQHEGEASQRDALLRARGTSVQLVTNAASSAANRLSQVRGEVSRFNDRLTAWKRSPGLYEMREGFLVFDRTLAGAKKAIFDDKLRGTIPAHLDLRKVLNPDLVNGGPAAPQSLVPRPVKSRDAFDLDIEGYLRADQGEVPAVNVAPGQTDNLLQNSTAP